MLTPFVELRSLLVKIYQAQEIELIIQEAGLPQAEIGQSNFALVYWNNILNKAIELNKLNDLIQTTFNYNGDITLRDFRERYADAINRNEIHLIGLVNLKKELVTLTDDDQSVFELVHTLKTNLYWTTVGNDTRNDGVEIFSLAANSDAIINLRLLNPKRASPFLGYKNYSLFDRDIYKEFDTEAEHFSDKIAKNESLILFQGARTGKTSFVNAGVIPQLLERDKSWLVIKVNQYDELLERSKKSVRLLPESDVQKPDDKNFFNKRPVLIILDNFESIYETLNPDERNRLFEDLAHLNDSDFKILLICRSLNVVAASLYNNRLLFDDKYEAHNDLLKFDTEKATEIVKALVKSDPNKVSYDIDLFQTIAVDCNNLEDESEPIRLPLFQIVCQQMYEAGKSPRRGFVSSVYQDENKARGIIFNSLKKNIDRKFQDTEIDAMSNEPRPIENERECVWQILSFLSLYPDSKGALFEEIIGALKYEAANESSRKQVRDIVRRLRESRLIETWSAGENARYRPVFKIYGTLAYDFVSSESPEIFQIKQIFRSVWNSFLYQNQLALARDLELLYAKRKLLDITPAQLLFLLRSAVAERQNVSGWLEMLHSYPGGKGNDLVRELENYNPFPKIPVESNFKDFKLAVRLLEPVGENPVPDASDNGKWLTRKAVAAPNPNVRKTALLALTILPDALQLKEMIKPQTDSIPAPSLSRRAEIFATLYDYLPKTQTAAFRIGIIDRSMASLWQFRTGWKANNALTGMFILNSGLFGGLLYGASMGILKENKTLSNFKENFDLMSFLGSFILLLILGFVLISTSGFVMQLAKYLFLPSVERDPADGYSLFDSHKKFANLLIVGALALHLGILNVILNLPDKNFWEITPKALISGALAGIGIGLGLLLTDKLSGVYKIPGVILGGIVAVTSVFLGVNILGLSDISVLLAQNLDSPIIKILNVAAVGFSFYSAFVFGQWRMQTLTENENGS